MLQGKIRCVQLEKGVDYLNDWWAYFKNDEFHGPFGFSKSNGEKGMYLHVNHKFQGIFYIYETSSRGSVFGELNEGVDPKLKKLEELNIIL